MGSDPGKSGGLTPPRRGQALPLPLLIALVATLAGGIRTITIRDVPPPEHSVTDRPVHVDDDGYLSSSRCKACHPSQYATWYGSYHRTMTQLATPEVVQADFNAVSVSGIQEQPMRLERVGRELWAEFDDPDTSSAGTPPRVRRQVVMLTGSHQQQVYWYRSNHNRLLGQLPGMYLIAERRWIPRRSAFLRPPPEHGYSETGRWNAVCIDCHATNGKRELNGVLGAQPLTTLVANTTVAEFGIACEACHGPGEGHVEANRNPVRRYRLHLTGAPDPTSVKPTRLDARRGSQVCGQCHSTSLRFDRVGINQRPAPPYQPGRDLDATHFVLQPTTNRDTPLMQTILESDPAALRDSFWSDGMVRVSGREYNGLIDSPCFKHASDASRTLSCFSCHTMHKTADDRRTVRTWADAHQLSSNASGNDACLQCHPSLRRDPSAHTKHEAGSSGSTCYNCHMPYTSYGLLRSLRSHQISSPTAAASIETGRPNACNLCHLDKTLAWTSTALASWYGTPQPALGEEERTIPASVLWTLRGDAGQRALMAWSHGWPPAQQISGTTWIAPTLSVLMNDPYEAVRLIAYRSLRSLPGFRDFRYEFTDDPKARTAGVMRVMDVWRRSGALAQSPTAPALLVDATGVIKPDVSRLLRLRDHRRIDLRE